MVRIYFFCLISFFFLHRKPVSLMTLIGKTSVEQIGLEAVNLLMFKSCATEKDRLLGTHLVKISKHSENDEKCPIPREKCLKKTCFFSYEVSESNLARADFPELTLFYINQGYFTVRKGERLIYGIIKH